KHSGIVAKREEMADPHLWNYAYLDWRIDRTKRKHRFGLSSFMGGFKDGNITFCRLRPRHRSTRGIRTFAHGMTADVVRQRAGLDDLRHGVDHRLNALAWRQETERQNDRLSDEA